MELYFHYFLLLVYISLATSRNFAGDEITRDEAQEIQEIVRDLKQQDANSNHHYVSHDHNDPHHLDDSTNIHTLNMVFKHNNIGHSKPIARIGTEDDPQASVLNDVICKLTGRCNIDLVNDVLDKNLDDANVNYNGIPLDSNNFADIDYEDVMKNPTDDSDNLENIERTFIIKTMTNGAGDGDKIRCSKGSCQLIKSKTSKKRGDTTHFLNKLETTLQKHNRQSKRMQDVRCGCGSGRADDNGEDEMDEATRLRCGCPKNKKMVLRKKKKKKKCGRSCRTGESDHSEVDNLTFLRCCKTCATLEYYQTSDGNPNDRDNDEIDDQAFVRCCKECGRSDYFRNVIMRIPDSREDEDPDEDRNDDSKGKNADISEMAKVYPINDDLDAIVMDVSDFDDILKFKNNGINYDNADPIRHFVRSGKEIFMAPKILPIPIKKTQNRLLPLTQKQKIKQLMFQKHMRRNVKPDVEKYGLPFQLDIQGLGQVNP